MSSKSTRRKIIVWIHVVGEGYVAVHIQYCTAGQKGKHSVLFCYIEIILRENVGEQLRSKILYSKTTSLIRQKCTLFGAGVEVKVQNFVMRLSSVV